MNPHASPEPRALQALQHRLHPDASPSPHDRRQSPRIPVDGRLMIEHDGQRFPLLDISAGGFAFAGDAPVNGGEATLTLGNVFRMQVQLLPPNQPSLAAHPEPQKAHSGAASSRRGRTRGFFPDSNQGSLYLSLSRLLLHSTPELAKS